MSSGSLFIFDHILLSLRPHLCVLSACSGSCLVRVCKSSWGLHVQINFMAGFIATPCLLIHQLRCDVVLGTQQSSKKLVHLPTSAGSYWGCAVFTPHLKHADSCLLFHLNCVLTPFIGMSCWKIPSGNVSVFLRLVLPCFFFCAPSPFPASMTCVFLNVLYYFSHHIRIVVFMLRHCTQNAKLSQSLFKKQGYSTRWKKYCSRPKIKKKYNCAEGICGIMDVIDLNNCTVHYKVMQYIHGTWTIQLHFTHTEIFSFLQKSFLWLLSKHYQWIWLNWSFKGVPERTMRPHAADQAGRH